MKPTIKKNYEITTHKDFTISFWDVMSQTWSRSHVKNIDNKTLSTWADYDRKSYSRAIDRYHRSFKK